jgi:4-hydroxybenzoyl-CoA reductase subunit beta
MTPMPPMPMRVPTTPDAVLAALREPGARILAGGTDLVPSLKLGLAPPGPLVSLHAVEGLRGVSHGADGSLRIGAMTSLSEVVRHVHVSRVASGLAAAAATIATPTLRNAGTLGGNVLLDTRCDWYNLPPVARASLGGCLKCDGAVCHVAPRGGRCWAAHSADTVPALILLGAELEVLSASDTGAAVHTRVPLQSVVAQSDGRTAHGLAAGALLLAVTLPARDARVVHRKVRMRGAFDFGVLLVAVARHDSGWSAVVSAVGPAPVRVDAPSGPALVEAAWAAVKPVGTHVVSPNWRRRMVRVEVARAVADLGG